MLKKWTGPLSSILKLKSEPYSEQRKVCLWILDSVSRCGHFSGLLHVVIFPSLF